MPLDMPVWYGFIPWTPRNKYLTPEPAAQAPAQTPPPPATASTPTHPKTHPADTKPEWLNFRTALMKVLNGFPDAKKAVIDYLVKSTNLPTPPPWANDPQPSTS
jgi:hypothetical protein